MRTRAPHIAWTDAQLAWIEANKAMIRREAYAEFRKLFNVNVSFSAYTSLCKRRGWKTGSAWRLQPDRKPRILSKLWTKDHLAWVEANRTMIRREAVVLFNVKFSMNVSQGTYNSLCKRMGWSTGRDGRLQSGSMPWNKGKKMPYNVNTARTQFKNGHIAPHKIKPVGHEWAHPNGYVYVIVAERNPHTGFRQRSVLKHKHLWEQKNGNVPKGHVLKCLDDNKANTDPSNWEAVPLGVNAFLNSRWSKMRYGEAPAELKPTVMTIAKLKHAKSSKTKARKNLKKGEQ